MSRRLVTLLFALLVSLWGSAAAAHGQDPAGIEVLEAAAGEVVTRVDAPSRSTVELELPAFCAPAGDVRVEERGPRRVVTRSFHCARSLSGETLLVTGLSADVYAVVHARLGNGSEHRAAATLRAPRVALEPAPTAASSFVSFLTMGMSHLATGADHLLFVLGLVVLARRARPVAAALTSFTVGHSVTLALAALGVVVLPPALAEIGIATSLVYVAILVARPDGAWGRRPLVGAAAMGLLHGMGFASAFREAGVPRPQIPLALLAFNLGIEIAQLAFVLALLAVWTLASRIDRLRAPTARALLGHAMGAVAAMWVIDRVLQVVLHPRA